MWLGFFYSRYAFQANLVSFDGSYKIESFTILKALYPMGQPAHLGKIGYIL